MFNLETFLKSPAIQRLAKQAEDQERTEREAERAVIARETDDRCATRDREIAKIESGLGKLEQAYQQKAAAAETARQALVTVQLQRERLRHENRSDRQRARMRLRQLADPRIRAACVRLNARLEKVRRDGYESSDRADLSKVGGWRVYCSNARGLEAVLKAGVAAVRALEALHERAVDDVEQAIADIEATVPFDQLAVTDETPYHRNF